MFVCVWPHAAGTISRITAAGNEHSGNERLASHGTAVGLVGFLEHRISSSWRQCVKLVREKASAEETIAKPAGTPQSQKRFGSDC